MKGKFFYTLLISLLITNTGNAQDAPENWFNLDPELDKVMGVGSDRAYSYLKNRTGKKVVVAVIDTGVDIDHEDIKDHVWINEDEIAGNGIDDDGNGYIDDIHGWNFIGGADGRNVLEDTHEMTREYVRLFLKYRDIPADSSLENFSDTTEFEKWVKLKKNFERIYDETYDQYKFYFGLKENVIYFDSLLRDKMKVDVLTAEDLYDKAEDDSLTAIGKGILNFVLTATEGNLEIPEIIDELKEASKHYYESLEYTYNVNFNPRSIVGDDYSDLFESDYGNPDVKGPDPRHGTHVAGIIGAMRNNGVGINGVANNVQIMSVRAVPHGDERDKDVANAIRYAVDNGAQIINMSFGKSYNYGKVAVDSAIQHAMDNGVLMIHAAGNEEKDRDKTPRYPVKEFDNGKVADNWVEVGANAFVVDENFVGSFSNYGSTYVDFFAPGVAVQSTIPGDEYEESQGTSMAAPMVSGVAALLMSYYPDLSYSEVIEILRTSVVEVDAKVLVPGTDGKKKNFKNMSRTGGVINAYKAVLMADLMSTK